MIIEKWEKMGIPLHIVIQGIDKTFEHLSVCDARRKKIHYLAYCEPEILNLWKDYRKKRGDSIHSKAIQPEKSREDQKKGAEYIAKKISGLIAQLTENLEKKNTGQELSKAVVNIRLKEKLINLRQEIRKSSQISVESIENQLQNLDEQLVESLLHFLHPRQVEALRLVAGRGIERYKNQMETVAYQETVQARFTELLREEFDIHRLSLYQ